MARPILTCTDCGETTADHYPAGKKKVRCAKCHELFVIRSNEGPEEYPLHRRPGVTMHRRGRAPGEG